jgi:hypothetical protein
MFTASVLVADVGEPPDVAKIDGEADHRQQELDLLVPGFSASVRRQGHHHHSGHVVLALLGVLAVFALHRRLLAVVLAVGRFLGRERVLLAVLPFWFGHCCARCLTTEDTLSSLQRERSENEMKLEGGRKIQNSKYSDGLM